MQHSAKRYKLARQTACLSVLLLGSVWRASNSISFLTLHLCPNKFLNANSYNAGPEETKYKTRCENAKYPNHNKSIRAPILRCYGDQNALISSLCFVNVLTIAGFYVYNVVNPCGSPKVRFLQKKQNFFTRKCN